jgi:capsular polysaccharide biosynthesis protein
MQLAIDSALTTGEMASTLKALRSESSQILKTVSIQSQQNRKSSHLDNEVSHGFIYLSTDRLQVRTFTWTDIELLDEVAFPMNRYIGQKKKWHWGEKNSVMTFVARIADSNPLKTVRVYNRQSREVGDCAHFIMAS